MDMEPFPNGFEFHKSPIVAIKQRKPAEATIGGAIKTINRMTNDSLFPITKGFT